MMPAAVCSVLSVQSPGITFQVTLGLDIYNGQPTFFVADSTGLQLTNFTASGTLSGNLAIGSLANVDATATATLSITMIRLPSIASKAITRFAWRFHVELEPGGQRKRAGDDDPGANLTADLSPLPGITWSPSFTARIDNGGFHPGSFNLNPPSAQSLLSSLASSFFVGGDIPLLGPISNALDQPLPLVNQSIAELTGVDGDLPQLPDVLSGLDPSDILNTLASYGIVVNGGDTSLNPSDPNGLPAMVNKLINGQYVNLISWMQRADRTPYSSSTTVGLPPSSALAFPILPARSSTQTSI